MNTPPVMDEEGAIETDRLRLEPLTVEHAAELFGVMSDPRLYTYIPHEPPATLPDLEARFRRFAARRSPCRTELWLNWVLRVKASGLAVGRVEATVRDDRTATVAYELGTAHWGHGLATEGCLAMATVLFSEYPVDELIAEVDTRNVASIRLLERLGFRRTAERKDADFFKGATSHEFAYALPRSSVP